MLEALVLAGGEFQEGEHAGEKKALIELRGNPLYYYVIRALEGSSYISRITLVGPPELSSRYKFRHKFIPEKGGGTLSDNLKMGLNALGEQNRVLQVTCDIPLVTNESIDYFVGRSLDNGAHLSIPLVEKRAYEERFPLSKRTWANMKEGAFTTGNIFYYDPKIILENFTLINPLLGRRKNVLAMASLFGLTTLIKYLTGRISVVDIEKRVSKKLGCNAVAIYTPYPEVAFDIDKPSDFEYFEKAL